MEHLQEVALRHLDTKTLLLYYTHQSLAVSASHKKQGARKQEVHK